MCKPPSFHKKPQTKIICLSYSNLIDFTKSIQTKKDRQVFSFGSVLLPKHYLFFRFLSSKKQGGALFFRVVSQIDWYGIAKHYVSILLNCKSTNLRHHRFFDSKGSKNNWENRYVLQKRCIAHPKKTIPISHKTGIASKLNHTTLTKDAHQTIAPPLYENTHRATPFSQSTPQGCAQTLRWQHCPN